MAAVVFNVGVVFHVPLALCASWVRSLVAPLLVFAVKIVSYERKYV